MKNYVRIETNYQNPLAQSRTIGAGGLILGVIWQEIVIQVD